MTDALKAAVEAAYRPHRPGGNKMIPVVQTLVDSAPCAVRLTGKLGGKHLADGMTAEVNLGDGAYSSIINPQSFIGGGAEWHCRYGDIVGIRYTVASLLDSYDHLLSGHL